MVRKMSGGHLRRARRETDEQRRERYEMEADIAWHGKGLGKKLPRQRWDRRPPEKTIPKNDVDTQ